jgi:hypothetical protein
MNRLHALGSEQKRSLLQLSCMLWLRLVWVPDYLSERYAEEHLFEAIFSAKKHVKCISVREGR